MLKFYIITSLIATGLTILSNIRYLSKNIRTYVNQNRKNKTIIHRILSELRGFLYCWIPLYNFVIIIGGVYLLFASEYSVIKMLDETKKKEEKRKREVERILNNKNDSNLSPIKRTEEELVNSIIDNLKSVDRL